MTEHNEKVEAANAIIENAIGELYRGLFRLRELKEYQEEYDTLGTLLNMLMEDREHIRSTYSDLKW